MKLIDLFHRFHKMQGIEEILTFGILWTELHQMHLQEI